MATKKRVRTPPRGPMSTEVGVSYIAVTPDTEARRAERQHRGYDAAHVAEWSSYLERFHREVLTRVKQDAEDLIEASGFDRQAWRWLHVDGENVKWLGPQHPRPPALEWRRAVQGGRHVVGGFDYTRKTTYVTEWTREEWGEFEVSPSWKAAALARLAHRALQLSGAHAIDELDELLPAVIAHWRAQFFNGGFRMAARLHEGAHTPGRKKGTIKSIPANQAKATRRLDAARQRYRDLRKEGFARSQTVEMLHGEHRSFKHRGNFTRWLGVAKLEAELNGGAKKHRSRRSKSAPTGSSGSGTRKVVRVL